VVVSACYRVARITKFIKTRLPNIPLRVGGGWVKHTISFDKNIGISASLVGWLHVAALCYFVVALAQTRKLVHVYYPANRAANRCGEISSN
jgi:hypothetical protein